MVDSNYLCSSLRNAAFIRGGRGMRRTARSSGRPQSRSHTQTHKAYLWAYNNLAERVLRTVAIGRKNWLFTGSDAGAERAAATYSLIATCKLCDPHKGWNVQTGPVSPRHGPFFMPRMRCGPNFRARSRPAMGS